ncbi:MAG: HAD family hydrolase [Desulfobacterales bacterium]
MEKRAQTISGVIFDLDGTLLDTLVDIADAFNAALTKRGLPGHPLHTYRDFVGDGPRVLTERALPADQRDAKSVDACLKDYLDFYRNNPEPEARPYPGIPGLLDALTEKGIPMAVVTNKEQEAADRVVKRLLGAWQFSPVLGYRDGGPRKPDPTMALAAAGRFGLPPEQIAFVGDTAVDMQTARAAGMVPVGALWGFRTPEELRNSGAAILLANPQQLMVHL